MVSPDRHIKNGAAPDRDCTVFFFVFYFPHQAAVPVHGAQMVKKVHGPASLGDKTLYMNHIIAQKKIMYIYKQS